ncbi:MAG: hypothetical protein ABR600_08645 [Actinomycetota bacterium]
MAAYLSAVTDTGEQALDLMKRAQSRGISAVAFVSDLVGSFVPDVHGLVPFADRIPAPEDAVKAYFGLAEKWMKANRDYSLAFVDAVSPVTEKFLPKPKARKGGAKTSVTRAA